MQLILHLLQSQLLPYEEDEVECILGMISLEGIVELESVFLETEDVHLLVVEIRIELVVDTREAALVQIVPHRLHDRSEAYILEVVFYHHLQILVDRENGHHIQIRLHPVEDGIAVAAREGMLIEHGEVFLVEFLDRYQQDRRIDIDTHLLIAALQEFAFAESLSEVGCYRYTAFHGVRFVYQLVLGFAIYNREAECILAHTDGESCLLCSFFTNYLHCRCLW